MDFSGVTIDTAEQVSTAIRSILRMNISPADKQIQITRLIRLVGSKFHGQLYGAVSMVFDSTAIASIGLSNADVQIERLSNKIVRNYALNRDTLSALVKEYYDSVLGRAESEAFKNAVSMQKHPTLERRLNGKGDCSWCVSKAGIHTNPTSDLFGRHDNCDCYFIVSGYNTRNGLLDNYKKKG